MFTGLVEAVGTVRSVRRKGAAALLAIDVGGMAAELTPGESVSVSGTCLTVTDVSAPVATFDCVAETMERTRLGDLSAGSAVNIERALAAGGRLGGHFVTGHVDGLASVRTVAPSDEGKMMAVEAEAELMEFVVEKGSVALDGVSLTVAAVSAGGFEVALVPFTLEHTTLGQAMPGQRLNLETDLLGKYVRRFLGGPGGPGGPGGTGAPGGGLDWEKLAGHGFI